MEEEEKNNDSLGDGTNQKGKSQKDKKAKRRKRLLKATPFIAIILIAMLVASCLIALVNVVVESGQEIINAIVNFFTGTQTTIELDDAKIDELIALIEATGVDLEDLELMRRD